MKAEFVLCFGVGSWRDLCNRNETLGVESLTNGRVCNWQDSSQLTINRVFPQVGSRILAHCLSEHPVRLKGESQSIADIRSDLVPGLYSPKTSVLIAIGGIDRIAQFRLVLASLLSQDSNDYEIIVVEQSYEPSLRDELPESIRYVHDSTETGQPFNKSRALNIGAALSEATYLLIHDADYVVPMCYVREVTRSLENADGVRPSRMNFHLDESSTKRLLQTKSLDRSMLCESIVQNNPTPMGVRRSAYWEIGGHDESFLGWGGEDLEFLSRLRTKKMLEGGWLPVIHLWHPPAPKKASGDRNQKQQDKLLSIPPSVRIRDLQDRCTYTR